MPRRGSRRRRRGAQQQDPPPIRRDAWTRRDHIFFLIKAIAVVVCSASPATWVLANRFLNMHDDPHGFYLFMWWIQQILGYALCGFCVINLFCAIAIPVCACLSLELIWMIGHSKHGIFIATAFHHYGAGLFLMIGALILLTSFFKRLREEPARHDFFPPEITNKIVSVFGLASWTLVATVWIAVSAVEIFLKNSLASPVHANRNGLPDDYYLLNGSFGSSFG